MNHCTASRPRQWLLAAGISIAAMVPLRAHDPNATITWNREISRIVYGRCASCHRQGGTSFSLTSYQDAQPRGTAIKKAVLSRRMPPWGAVKGFGSFRNDQGLTQEEISLIADWVESGMLKGNNPNVLPPLPKFTSVVPPVAPKNAVRVSGDVTIVEPMVLDGVMPEHVPSGASMQVVADLPDGAIEPLVWLYEYKDSYRHPFLFRKAVEIPAGTVIHGVPRQASILLLPAAKTTP